jgi:hypothetical protein
VAGDLSLKSRENLKVLMDQQVSEVAEELSWSPVTNLLMHQKLADVLLLGE